MTYFEALNYINNISQFGDKPGLERVGRLLENLGNPHKNLKFVHVAGTNGKGSVCSLTESVLRNAGYKTGLYISPYVEDYRERIQVNRELIPKDDLARLMALVSKFRGDARKFEIETAIALRYFYETKCDIVVLEVGLGGRLDATNIIPSPEVAAITSISFDHMHILGGTIEKITSEKRGIIKPGCDVVEALNIAPPDIINESLEGSKFIYNGGEYNISLVGEHQVLNAAVAIEIINALRRRGWEISDTALNSGLLAARWNGRFEVIRKKPLCILDGAHNESAVATLCDTVAKHLSAKKIITVMALGKDKLIEQCVPPVYNISKKFIATELTHMKSHSAEEVAAATSKSPCPTTEVIPDISQACLRALEIAEPDDVILICGSLYMLGEAKEVLAQTKG